MPMHRPANSSAALQSLILVRHGATAPNLAGLRCGGDLDVPLTDLGRQQAASVARQLQQRDLPVGVIVASALQRTQETADIISRMLGGIEVLIEPAFAERHLGAWNLRCVAETEDALVSGVTPPGGESSAEFIDRIAAATQDRLLPRLARRPLLVGSKGVGRALRELLGMPRTNGLSNGELLLLNLATLTRRDMNNCHA